MYQSGDLVFPDSMEQLSRPDAWSSFRNGLYEKKWVAHVKETSNGKGNAIEYLGRYTNKVAITDSRILSVSEEEVTFTIWGNDGRQSRKVTIPPEEFVKRYLLHVLPKFFQKIHNYGYLNNRSRERAIL